MSTEDYWTILFAFLTIACGGLTVRAFARGHQRIQVLLLGMLTAYAFTIALNRFVGISHLKHLAAIPLGVVGVVAYVIGAPTDLPILFILLGIGGAVDLVWDPFTVVYETGAE